MSTRAHIQITDGSGTLMFYRHSDGYPSCTGESLKEFIQGYKDLSMRTELGQSAGWLILKGHAEYLSDEKKPFSGMPNKTDKFSGWKVGAYEPTTNIHGDEEYIYIINLKDRILSCKVPNAGFWDNPSLENTKACKEFKAVRF